MLMYSHSHECIVSQFTGIFRPGLTCHVKYSLCSKLPTTVYTFVIN